MNDTGDPTQNGQTDVDQEVSIASALQEHTQRRQDECEDNLADVTGRPSQSRGHQNGDIVGGMVVLAGGWEAAMRLTASSGRPKHQTTKHR